MQTISQKEFLAKYGPDATLSLSGLKGTAPQAPSYSQGVEQAASEGLDKAKQGIETLTHPQNPTDVVAGATKAAAGAIETAASPLAPVFSPLGKIIGYVADKLSDTKPFQDYGRDTASLPADYHPTGEKVLDFAADAGTVAGAATPIKGAPAVASAAKTALTEARDALGGITASGAEGIAQATTRSLDPASLMQRVARIPKGKQAAFEERAGVPVGQYLVDRHIFGTPDKIVDQLYDRFQQSKNEADTAIAKLPGTYRNSAVGGMLKELRAREQSISAPGAVSKDLQRVTALQKKMQGQGLTMSEINEVKRLYEANVKLDYIKDNVSTKVEKANNLDSAVRQWQLTNARQLGLKNLDKINKETMLARQLADDLGHEYTGQAGNNAISITDWITLSGGTPANAAMFLTKQALGSKTVMSKVAELQAGSTPKIAAPKAEMGAATIDNYKNFLERTGGAAKP